MEGTRPGSSDRAKASALACGPRKCSGQSYSYSLYASKALGDETGEEEDEVKPSLKISLMKRVMGKKEAELVLLSHLRVKARKTCLEVGPRLTKLLKRITWKVYA